MKRWIFQNISLYIRFIQKVFDIGYKKKSIFYISQIVFNHFQNNGLGHSYTSLNGSVTNTSGNIFSGMLWSSVVIFLIIFSRDTNIYQVCLKANKSRLLKIFLFTSKFCIIFLVSMVYFDINYPMYKYFR